MQTLYFTNVIDITFQIFFPTCCFYRVSEQVKRGRPIGTIMVTMTTMGRVGDILHLLEEEEADIIVGVGLGTLIDIEGIEVEVMIGEVDLQGDHSLSLVCQGLHCADQDHHCMPQDHLPLVQGIDLPILGQTDD